MDLPYPTTNIEGGVRALTSNPRAQRVVILHPATGQRMNPKFILTRMDPNWDVLRCEAEVMRKKGTLALSDFIPVDLLWEFEMVGGLSFCSNRQWEPEDEDLVHERSEKKRMIWGEGCENRC